MHIFHSKPADLRKNDNGCNKWGDKLWNAGDYTRTMLLIDVFKLENFLAAFQWLSPHLTFTIVRCGGVTRQEEEKKKKNHWHTATKHTRTVKGAAVVESN